MKAALNGGLNLSVLDGWWIEAFSGQNGWAISSDPVADPRTQDARDAEALYGLLEREVVPQFYERDAAGLARRCGLAFAHERFRILLNLAVCCREGPAAKQQKETECRKAPYRRSGSCKGFADRRWMTHCMRTCSKKE